MKGKKITPQKTKRKPYLVKRGRRRGERRKEIHSRGVRGLK